MKNRTEIVKWVYTFYLRFETNQNRLQFEITLFYNELVRSDDLT